MAMTTETISLQRAATQAAQALAARVDLGRILLPGGAAYDEATHVWNGAATNRPALIVRCETADEVGAAVRAARAHGLPLSIRGGGHDWAGRALRDGGLVVDLTHMRAVAVRDGVATVAGGATAADVVAAAERHGLTAVTGIVGAVGMAGLTLGGGYGRLNGRLGLAADNLRGAEVVLADGRAVVADETHEPELYWALRGGGGNFGVVTALRVRLHPLATVLAGAVAFPWDQAPAVLRGYADLLARAPDELTADCAIVSAPDGAPTLAILPTWCGDPAAGAPFIDQIRALGAPALDQVALMPYAAALGLGDQLAQGGRSWAVRTRTLAGLTPHSIATLVAGGASRTSPLSTLNISHFHGAPARVPVASTAFGLRRDHLMVQIIAGWEPGDGDGDGDGARHRAWADGVSAALAPDALPGGYPNLLGPDDDEQTVHAYGANTARLLGAKARYDPDGVFTATALPLPAPRR